MNTAVLASAKRHAWDDANIRTPFVREGLATRIAPFAAAGALAFVLIPLPGTPDHMALVAIAACLTASIVGAVMLVPWPRLPSWLQALPALAFVLVVAVVRESQGGASSGYIVLAMLPLFWLALYGTRGQLLAALALLAMILITPMLALDDARYPQSDWTRIVLWLSIGSLVGLSVQSLVEGTREQTEKLRMASLLDPLTGIANRRAWANALDRELARADREGYCVSVAMLDLDRFKAFNDSRGHRAGDELLQRAVSGWQSELRASDMIARHGGEEFAVLLPGCGPDAARAIVDRLRNATPWGQTCSAGVACWSGIENGDTLLARADSGMYRAKHAGRNLTEVAA